MRAAVCCRAGKSLRRTPSLRPAASLTAPRYAAIAVAVAVVVVVVVVVNNAKAFLRFCFCRNVLVHAPKLLGIFKRHACCWIWGCWFHLGVSGTTCRF